MGNYCWKCINTYFVEHLRNLAVRAHLLADLQLFITTASGFWELQALIPIAFLFALQTCNKESAGRFLTIDWNSFTHWHTGHLIYAFKIELCVVQLNYIKKGNLGLVSWISFTASPAIYSIALLYNLWQPWNERHFILLSATKQLSVWVLMMF